MHGAHEPESAGVEPEDAASDGERGPDIPSADFLDRQRKALAAVSRRQGVAEPYRPPAEGTAEPDPLDAVWRKYERQDDPFDPEAWR
jgi:hypothetical protein